MRGHGIVRACLRHAPASGKVQREAVSPLSQTHRPFTSSTEGPPAEKDTEVTRGLETLLPATEEYRAARAFEAKFEGWRAPDPATSAIIQTVSGQTPGVPPGAHHPRVSGSHEPTAPLHFDPVGPWGVTTGPGRGPSDYERMQRRHARASNPMVHMQALAFAWHQPACPHQAHTTRGFTKRVEANPGGANVQIMDEQAADSATVVDEAVSIFEKREDGTEYHAVKHAHATSTSAHINPPPDPAPLEASDLYTKSSDQDPAHHSTASTMPSSLSRVERMDSPAGADQALGSAAQKAAGEAQAQSMSTRGFINPGADSNTPDSTNTAPVAEHVDPDGAFSKEAQTTAAEEQVSGMSTAGSIKTRGFFTAPQWFAGGTPPPDAEGPDMHAARKQSRDSYAESEVDGPEPVDVGAVGNLNSGVNVLGGTPIKPQSERMTQESQLHRDTESMTPEIPDPVLVETIGPQSSGGNPSDKTQTESACATDELFTDPFQVIGMEESGLKHVARKTGKGLEAHGRSCSCSACQRSAHGPACGCQTCTRM
ncbi:g12651 [Coccomyxa viridis]|uniref:G12651 protein n=1 Tax=Coccomyxa viridis TaxID=1274662 RepID=A0ABP1GFJ4_9CHLO